MKQRQSQMYAILIVSTIAACNHGPQSTAKNVNASINIDDDSNLKVLNDQFTTGRYSLPSNSGRQGSIDLLTYLVIDSPKHLALDRLGRQQILITSKAADSGLVPKSKAHLLLSVASEGQLIDAVKHSAMSNDLEVNSKPVQLLLDDKAVGSIVLAGDVPVASNPKPGDQMPSLQSIISAPHQFSLYTGLTVSDLCSGPFDNICTLNASETSDSDTGAYVLSDLSIDVK